MRIYMFKSETRKELRAFAGDIEGSRLPVHHGPWTATGVIAPKKVPPHRISREAVEKAIADDGFQLFRLRDKQ